ncbi:hypothetical protein [Achromobacter xylosoxidans]|uniref:Dephospho-CoA kinase n=1 Tax=Alcaligenes xylosoxydans xylosoxydans TaxID=85698 RepID=A0A1R1JUF5_ALCXX|nr:hypothetical protein [Achromobacter xylosoxidans]OMG87985.1 hypothetical protein BIZ92_10330 [Achromobacter xylosoxidans]
MHTPHFRDLPSAKSRSGPYLLVGLAGHAGAGKDTCADILASAHGFARLAFADAVRAELAAAFGVDLRLFSNRSTKEAPTHELALHRCADRTFVELMLSLPLGLTLDRALSPRWAMRLWGTEYRRSQSGKDYWLLRAHEALESLQRDGWRRIAITDVRFANEAALVNSLGGEVWRVKRPIADAVLAPHASEQEVTGIQVDRVIDNSAQTTAALAYDVLFAYHLATCTDHAFA